ncbi:hypothetical protein ElyMa_001769100 [Elysia marginata]|uniref:Uncharacterized protein n=1 Tax=Elysia marginata TaxID=1093978 RepID=A0AAV4EC33_9GAST|nr:hypothetical protein ElyMa_001769100 [Elysia marginata]
MAFETEGDLVGELSWFAYFDPDFFRCKVQKSTAKVVATKFWDEKGVILFDILPQGQCIYGARPNTAALLTASEMQLVAKDLDSKESVLCFSTIMPPLIQQTLHSNGNSPTVGKFFLILPTFQTPHPLTFICLDP